MDINLEITNYFNQYTKLLNMIDKDEIEMAFLLLRNTLQVNGKVYCIGNGGSASTASHFANDFNKGLKFYTDNSFNFVCLSDNIATLTAIANDEGYNEVYRYQLMDNLQEKDIVLAISGSGNSENIINAVEYAYSCGNKIIGLTGFDGGRLKELADISIHVPIDNMQITEDIHLMINHLLMTLFKKYFDDISFLNKNLKIKI